MWYESISPVIGILALLVSLLNLRHNKNIQASKELKEKFEKLEIEYNERIDKLEIQLKETNENLDSMIEQYNKLGVLEERINNEINVSVKYRDKFEAKLDEILRMIYAQK